MVKKKHVKKEDMEKYKKKALLELAKMKKTLNHVERKVKEYIHHNPKKSAMVAAAVAAAVGAGLAVALKKRRR
jgi:hypothetical protein